MTTPWISRPRWTCKYCNVTINDDVPSRTHHESGLRHKGNVERSLREAYKKSQRERTEEQHAKREMDKIERLARERHAQDGLKYAVGISTKHAEGSKQSRPLNWKPSQNSSAYGYALPVYAEEEAKREEAGMSNIEADKEKRGVEGVAGEWETVSQPVDRADTTPATAPRTTAETSVNTFRVREKSGDYDINEDSVHDLKPIKIKKRKHDSGGGEEEIGTEVGVLPQWTPLRLDTGVGIKREGVQAVPIRKEESNPQRPLKIEADTDASEEKVDVKGAIDELAPPPSTSSSAIFKKRKAGAGAGAKKVRAVI